MGGGNSKFKPISPLYMAADKGDYDEVIRLVEEERVDVNFPDEATKPPGGTALGTAHTEEIARYLLDHGADHGANYEGWDGTGGQKQRPTGTATTSKASDGRVVTVIDYGLEKLPPFLFATVRRRPAAMKVIMGCLGTQRALTLASYESGNTAMTLAGMCGYPEVIRNLHADGANVDVSNKEGKTAVHLAAMSGKGQAVKMLLQLGANPEIRDVDERTPLAAVCALEHDMNHRWAIDHLLDARVDVDGADTEGWRPLHHCARHANYYALKGLSEVGADPVAETYNNETPQMIAEKNFIATEELYNEEVKKSGKNQNDNRPSDNAEASFVDEYLDSLKTKMNNYRLILENLDGQAGAFRQHPLSPNGMPRGGMQNYPNSGNNSDNAHEGPDHLLGKSKEQNGLQPEESTIPGAWVSQQNYPKMS